MPVPGLQPGGLPHSDISGSVPVCRSPELFAAYHVLLRLQKPRHPPFALVTFISFLCLFGDDCVATRICTPHNRKIAPGYSRSRALSSPKIHQKKFPLHLNAYTSPCLTSRLRQKSSLFHVIISHLRKCCFVNHRHCILFTLSVLLVAFEIAVPTKLRKNSLSFHSD